ncbi:type I-C CRISPR-associated protein Cas8c/Csd1 [Desulfovibrio sp. JC022]|uniref:type I-C CRISPR-associated protein Cas8c/Csd1 n=1 Tax=Desulfovibrio sp. JC022 TaxID=2593642 RepID=UPI0013D7AD84|nr:type I-C CRISPR-associated protein Cas8c/Csd1 [Desulfovibrio sp. JC022]NDV24309.1 type I-C CRISPR-associated protein Cas8c/Csd1 [Desulfovibrio sp. JC022]
MILQALNDYYIRMADDPAVDVPPFGFGRQGVHFCLTIDREGNLVGDPLDLRENGKPVRIEVPGPVGRSGNTVLPNFVWDNTGYVLGVDGKGKPERTTKTHEGFKDLAFTILEGVDDDGGHALLSFLEKWEPEKAESLKGWDEVLDSFLVFRLDGELGFLHERPSLREAWSKYLDSKAGTKKGKCLVTGEDDVSIPNTHAKIKGVPGAQTAGAALVSFNIDSAESLGKKQNQLSPISEKAAFAYTTALNHLLAPGSSRKVQVGDTTVLFWTEAPKEVEGLFGLVMGAKESEDTDLAKRLGGLLSTLASGKLPRELGKPETPFYVLGLSPNAARLSVRFWHVGTVGEMFSNIGKHFEQMALSGRPPKTPENPSPWWILKELAAQQDSRNISPLLSGQLLKAIIRNSPYPMTLLNAAIGRIRADKNIGYIRAGIIKAVLVRNYQQEINMALDKENGEIGYRLGRLFAIVERIQEEAVPGSNATVRDRFFSSASATPARTFPVILRNAQNGLAKIRKEKPGYAVNLDKSIQEILGEVDSQNGFPAALNLEKQGMFIIGYYQQRQDFFTPKQTATEA